ncbi:hypothetical protein QYC42_01945 [Ligilactobacillus salivarius]|uniref:hypothetical protein n=1 Tax=Ligilactobacillus salivarius TaxID=1624 RepID=UPI00263AA110|nr:hypothetical protein [Ligilactobacillus salivarius]MDN4847731.1 hypothetical protein [Ligilactobacillus salivarius]
MGKKFKGFLNKEYVGSIEEVNKYSDKFYEDFSSYIYANVQDKREYSKLSRFIDLLKISDIYVTDMGDVVDLKYDNLLEWILMLDIGVGIKNKINRMRKELKLIQNIKSNYLENSDNDSYESIQKCNYIFNKEYIKLKKHKSIYVSSNMENAISCASYYFKQINDINIELLNEQNNKNLFFCDFKLVQIVQMWKFSDAQISQDDNGKIIVDNINDISNAFVVTRNLNKDNRNLARDISLSKLGVHSVEDYLIGVGEELFFGLDESDIDRDTRFQILRRTTLYGITIPRWIECLQIIKKAITDEYEKNQNYFININHLNIARADYYEIRQIAMILHYHNDFLDTPFLVSNGEIFVYVPAIIVGDAVHYLNVAIKYSKDKSIQNTRGNNFENTIGRLLEYHGNDFCKSENDDCGNSIKVIYSEHSRQHEIDLVATDDDEQVVQFECKTFMDPFNYRDYRIEIDKMFAGQTNGYLENDFGHFKSLKNNGYEIIINNIRNQSAISKNKSVSTYFQKSRNWSDMYMIFISNYVFPNNMVKEWNNKYGIYFLHWFELNRLIKKLPLDSDLIIVGGTPFLNSKIKTSITDKFNRENIRKISDGQYISSLVNHRKSENSRIVANEIEIIPGVCLKYYE